MIVHGLRSPITRALGSRSRCHVALPKGNLDNGLTDRDSEIFALALGNLSYGPIAFDEALRVLREAVLASIPAGRIFMLARTVDGPIIGSLISRVGIVADLEGTRVVRVDRDGRAAPLGRFER